MSQQHSESTVATGAPLAHRVPWQDVVRVAFVALAAAAVWFRIWEPLPRLSVIGLIATVVGGWPIFSQAFWSDPAAGATRRVAELLLPGRRLILAP